MLSSRADCAAALFIRRSISLQASSEKCCSCGRRDAVKTGEAAGVESALPHERLYRVLIEGGAFEEEARCKSGGAASGVEPRDTASRSLFMLGVAPLLMLELFLSLSRSLS